MSRSFETIIAQTNSTHLRTQPGAMAAVAPQNAIGASAAAISSMTLRIIMAAHTTTTAARMTTMAGVRAEYGPGSVVGLASSAAAAEVLADAVGVPTENTAKWIIEHRSLPECQARWRRLAAHMAGAYPSQATRQLQLRAQAEPVAFRRWALRPGQLVIVDEAPMAAVKDLDYITAAATKAGAKVLLVGDWAQLSPVQAGGAFKLLADAAGQGVATLRDVRRFRQAWEGDATLRLRVGDVTVAEEYAAHGRVESGARIRA